MLQVALVGMSHGLDCRLYESNLLDEFRLSVVKKWQDICILTRWGTRDEKNKIQKRH